MTTYTRTGFAMTANDVTEYDSILNSIETAENTSLWTYLTEEASSGWLLYGNECQVAAIADGSPKDSTNTDSEIYGYPQYCYWYNSQWYKALALIVVTAVFFVFTFGFSIGYSLWKSTIELSGGYTDLESQIK
eukprot:CAMPEP_0170491164 /NCGR_PEP_ID=MMETSP0208-20121228/10510_1 /TAXON_ID=197538 /ORGANISM="Strombidium inclinatum, Strain S3" /LENGTH=132 /DNA_ID=CAMNT_0010766691 /DNA_START=23 /DNA_END=421 /DNA_ORIENTATION=+